MIALDVLITETAAVQQAIQSLRDKLQREDPTLAVFVAGEVQGE